MIPTLLPSRNRACQLHALLETVNINCPNLFDFQILWRADNDEYNNGYQKLQQHSLGSKCHWYKEEDCCKDYHDFLSRNFVDNKQLIGFFTDDCLFYRPIELSETEVYSAFDNDDHWCLSLRLGLNTVLHSYTENIWQAPVQIDQEVLNNKLIRYKHTDRIWHENYGWRFGWDGVIYRNSDIKEMSQDLSFTDLRTVEAVLTRKQVSRQFMVIPYQSCVVCMQYNCVHTRKGYFGSVFTISEQELNDRYLAGEVIDWRNMNFSNVISCHDEIPVKFRSTYFED